MKPSGYGDGYWRSLLSDSKTILTSPSKWERGEWIRAALVAGVTVGLYGFDGDIREWTQENRNGVTEDFAYVGNRLGDGLYVLPALGAFYLYGNIGEKDRAKRTAQNAFKSFIISGVITQAIKFTAQRHRPYTGSGYDRWDGPAAFPVTSDRRSFPSGHSQTAFSIATVIASEYEESRFIPPIAYGLASLTALSRVHDDDHWASDVFAGSAIGYFIAKAVVATDSKKGRRSVELIPIIDGGNFRLSLTYRF